jgi:hypothetical protein
MRYYTREFYLNSQDEIGLEETAKQRDLRLEWASRDWKRADEAYWEYVATIRRALPGTVQKLVDECLHDAVVATVNVPAGAVDISLDTSHAPFTALKPGVRLRFSGVVQASGLEHAVGQAILYHEVHVADDCFEFSALLARTEIVVNFVDVSLR